MQKETTLSPLEIVSLSWEELSKEENQPLLDAINTCYRAVFDYESGFDEDAHTPELVQNLMEEQLGGKRNENELILVALDDWDESKHTSIAYEAFGSGYKKVKFDGKNKAVVGVAWTPGNNTDEKFLEDTIIRTATLFKPEDEAEKIVINTREVFETMSASTINSIAYASEMAIRKIYRDGLTSAEMLRLSGLYLMSIGMSEFMLWTDKSSPMFDAAKKRLKMRDVKNLNERDRHLFLGNLEFSTANLERSIKMLMNRFGNNKRLLKPESN